VGSFASSQVMDQENIDQLVTLPGWSRLPSVFDAVGPDPYVSGLR